MKIPEGIKVYGDLKYRGECPKESAEQITYVNRIRSKYPKSYGLLVCHVKNEQKLVNGQFQAIAMDRAMGMAVGCPDIFIPGKRAFVCEIKRQDPTKSKISDEQIAYLLAAQKNGAFVCVALGCNAATEAFDDWVKLNADKN